MDPVLMVAAFVFGSVVSRIGLPPLVGYNGNTNSTAAAAAGGRQRKPTVAFRGAPFAPAVGG